MKNKILLLSFLLSGCYLRYYVAVAQSLKYTLNRSKVFDALNFKIGLRAFLFVNFS